MAGRHYVETKRTFSMMQLILFVFAKITNRSLDTALEFRDFKKHSKNYK